MQFKVYNYKEFTVCLGAVSPDTTQTFPNNAERVRNSYFYFPFATVGNSRIEYANGDVLITQPNTLVDVQNKRNISFTVTGSSFGGWAALNFVDEPTFTHEIIELQKDESLSISTTAGQRKVLWVLTGSCVNAENVEFIISRPGNISENKTVSVTATVNSKVCVLTEI